MSTISYVVTACNEHVELERLLDQLNEYIDGEDEIIVQLDTRCTPEVKQVSEKYNTGSRYEYHRIHCDLNMDFASFKNNAMGFCSRDYIVFIDADEYLTETFYSTIKFVLEANPDIDCISIPRVNTVEGLTEKHIKDWCWGVNDKGWVNWPDYQSRICKHRVGIKWAGKVHERLVSWQNGSNLPPLEEWALQHPKTIERQEKQNSSYDQMQ
jgi:glycosyltransferase involved in cell wall biosynthesis